MTIVSSLSQYQTVQKIKLHRPKLTELPLINYCNSCIAGSSVNKKFGSEPDLRVEEEQQKSKCNKHFRKKYRAPPPPVHNNVSFIFHRNKSHLNLSVLLHKILFLKLSYLFVAAPRGFVARFQRRERETRTPEETQTVQNKKRNKKDERPH